MRADPVPSVTVATPPPAGTASDWPSPRRAWFVIFLLVLAFASSFIDRQILSLLVDPIRADLEISDTEFSLLVGLAFSMVFVSFGIPIAYASDRISRRLIIAAGVFAWNVMTVLSGLSGTYWQLFAARMGVGVGEATLTPAASSLISDYFPRERRGLATAVYTTGVYWGSGLALMIGGIVVKAVEAAPPVEWPLVGELRPWQTVLVIVGLPGVLVAAAMLLIREPVRRGLAPGSAGTLAPMMPFLRANRATIFGLFLGFTLLGTVVVAYLTWIPAAFMRSFGWNAAEIGLAFGLIVTTCGSLGITLGGMLADRLTARGHADAAVRAGFYGGLVTIPLATVAPLMPSPGLILAASAVLLLAVTSTQALPLVAIQSMAPNNLRARMVAVYLMVGSLILFTAGPTSVALLTDYLFEDDAAVRYSLAVLSAVIAPLGVLLLWWSLPHYRRSLAASASWE